MPIDYTTVVGVDERHLRQLSWTWPTWKKHKPSILRHPMLVFFDSAQLTAEQVEEVVDHPDLSVHDWPRQHTEFAGDNSDKFSDPQRHKMLAGFLHVPAAEVTTRYWLKIDTDTVATGNDDWIDTSWFAGDPAIVSHPWGFTKPPNQMILMDEWCEKHSTSYPYLWDEMVGDDAGPLNLKPAEGSSRLSHKRIISWTGFFQTQFTQHIAYQVDVNTIPVPSQDGYFWYMATRFGRGVVRANMKERGWKHQSSDRGVMQAAQEAMND